MLYSNNLQRYIEFRNKNAFIVLLTFLNHVKYFIFLFANVYFLFAGSMATPGTRTQRRSAPTLSPSSTRFTSPSLPQSTYTWTLNRSAEPCSSIFPIWIGDKLMRPIKEFRMTKVKFRKLVCSDQLSWFSRIKNEKKNVKQ